MRSSVGNLGKTMEFDTFISYFYEDRSWVQELVKELRKHEIRVWIDFEHYRPGMNLDSEFGGAIKSTRSIIVCIGPSGIGPWQRQENRALLIAMTVSGYPIIPVILPGTPDTIDMPVFLRSRHHIDFRSGFTREGIEQLVWGISGERPTATDEAYKEVELPQQDFVRPKAARLREVFRTVGLPEFTYVEPRIYKRVASAVRDPGKHLIVEGPSGSGKTCMVFRIVDELGFKEPTDYRYLSALGEQNNDTILATAHAAAESKDTTMTIIDDIHFLSQDARDELAKILKLCSNSVFRTSNPPKFILIGIPTAASGLLLNVHDLGPRIGIFRMPQATKRELRDLIREGEERLSIEFPRATEIIDEASQSFFLCQYICHEICYLNRVFETLDERRVLSYRIGEVRAHLVEELADRFEMPLLTWFRSVGKDRQKKSMILSLVRILGETKKSIVHMNEIIQRAGDHGVSLEKIADQIPQMPSRRSGEDTLSKLLYYDLDTQRFTIEDPTFGYYLRYLDVKALAEAAGISPYLIRIDTSGRLKPVSDEPKERTASERNQVFISYSHRDREWLDRLQTTLKPLVRSGQITTWNDQQIKAGARWFEEIERALSLAKVAVLLVSSNFLASDFIDKHELSPLLEVADKEGVTILWVAVSASMYDETEIAKYQAANDPFRPLNSLSAAETDRVLVEICKKIRDAVNS